MDWIDRRTDKINNDLYVQYAVANYFKWPQTSFQLLQRLAIALQSESFRFLVAAWSVSTSWQQNEYDTDYRLQTFITYRQKTCSSPKSTEPDDVRLICDSWRSCLDRHKWQIERNSARVCCNVIAAAAGDIGEIFLLLTLPRLNFSSLVLNSNFLK